MNHTPGPWITRYSDDAPSGEPLFSVDSQSNTVCAGAMESDARLIAAAPALLEALQLLMSDPARKGLLADTVMTARAAIAAATGEQ